MRDLDSGIMALASWRWFVYKPGICGLAEKASLGNCMHIRLKKIDSLVFFSMQTSASD